MKLEQSSIPRKEKLLVTDEKKLEKVIAMSLGVEKQVSFIRREGETLVILLGFKYESSCLQS